MNLNILIMTRNMLCDIEKLLVLKQVLVRFIRWFVETTNFSLFASSLSFVSFLSNQHRWQSVWKRIPNSVQASDGA